MEVVLIVTKSINFLLVLVKTSSKTLNTPHKSECSTSNTMEEDDPNEDSNEMQNQPKETLSAKIHISNY